MNYIIEILNVDNEIVDTKKTYTIEELKEFYKREYGTYGYRVYKICDFDMWS